MNSPIFETPRLLVRQLHLDDFPAFFEMQGNPKTHLYTGSLVEDEATCRGKLEKLIGGYSDSENQYHVWGIERKSDGAFVGTCAVVWSECPATGEGHEIGYRFLERHWGNGYASEVCDPLISHALGSMKVPWLFGRVDILNVASRKVLDRCQLKFLEEYFDEKENATERAYWSKA